MVCLCGHGHRWGLKFFNSESESKDGLGDKQRACTHDMCSASSNIVREELEIFAKFRPLPKSAEPVHAGKSNAPAEKSETRCNNIKTALRTMLGDGLRDGSFLESSVRKDGNCSVKSTARTHHAIFLFSPSKGQAALRDGLAEVHTDTRDDVKDGEGLAKEVKDDAKRLSEALKKYGIVLHWVDTFSTMAGLLLRRQPHSHVQEAMGDTNRSASMVAARESSRESVLYFLQECMRECKGAIIPLEALLLPAQVRPFTWMLVCSAPFLLTAPNASLHPQKLKPQHTQANNHTRLCAHNRISSNAAHRRHLSPRWLFA